MQGKLLAFGLISAVGGGAFIMGSQDAGEVYPMDREEVSARLTTAGSDAIFGQDMARGMDITVSKRGYSQVIWEFSTLGEPLASFTADLEQEGAGTRVTVSFDMAEGRLSDAAKEDLGEAREFFETMLTTGMIEHVDATLESRPFDDEKVARSIASTLVTNPGAVKKYMRRMQEVESGAEDLAIKREVESMQREAYEYANDSYLVTDPTGYDPTPRDDPNW